MNCIIPDRVLKDVSTFARRHGIEEIILFDGFTERSDIDLAVCGGDFDSFYWDVKEKTHSLLMFDLVELDVGVSEELKTEIERDGVVIYEKAG